MKAGFGSVADMLYAVEFNVKISITTRFCVVFDIDLNQTDERFKHKQFAPDQEKPELF